jgi:hypothetical protein
MTSKQTVYQRATFSTQFSPLVTVLEIHKYASTQISYDSAVVVKPRLQAVK